MAGTPYVTAAEFEAHPTYLDLDDLRSGIADAGAQTAELTNILLMASSWADGQCNQSLAAHRVVRRTRGRIGRDGILTVFPGDRPVLAVESIAYGTTVNRMNTLPAPNAWVGDDQSIQVPAGRIAPRGQVHVEITYIAGWVSTVLADAAWEDASTLAVDDATGILPGASYRLWSPGAEETVTVSPAWTPAPGSAVIPLDAPTRHSHSAGDGLSGMPAAMRLAVINYTVSQLMRPDTSAEDSYPDTTMSPATRKRDSRKDGSGLVTEGERLLAPFVRRM